MEVTVIDSQPSASRPRNPRLVARRLMPRRQPVGAASSSRALVGTTSGSRTSRTPSLLCHSSPGPCRSRHRRACCRSWTPSRARRASRPWSCMRARASCRWSRFCPRSSPSARCCSRSTQHIGGSAGADQRTYPDQAAHRASRPTTNDARRAQPELGRDPDLEHSVVLLRDLPLEHGAAARIESERGTPAPRAEVERSRPAGSRGSREPRGPCAGHACSRARPG